MSVKHSVIIVQILLSNWTTTACAVDHPSYDLNVKCKNVLQT